MSRLFVIFELLDTVPTRQQSKIQALNTNLLIPIGKRDKVLKGIFWAKQGFLAAGQTVQTQPKIEKIEIRK